MKTHKLTLHCRNNDILFLRKDKYTSKIYMCLNHKTGSILVYNTGTDYYTSIVHNTSIPVLWSPSTGDPKILLKLGCQQTTCIRERPFNLKGGGLWFFF